MSIKDWDAPTLADLRDDREIDEGEQYQRDVEETQDYIVLTERMIE